MTLQSTLIVELVTTLETVTQQSSQSGSPGPDFVLYLHITRKLPTSEGSFSRAINMCVSLLRHVQVQILVHLDRIHRG